MKTFHYKTLKGFMAANGIRQFTLSDFRREIIWKPGVGTIKFVLSDEAREEFARGIAGCIWSKVDDERIYKVLHADERMGILRRLWLDSKGNYTYCAGQDYPSEIRYIQRHI